MSMIRAEVELQTRLRIFEVAVTVGGVARQCDSLSQGDDQSFFMQIASFKIKRINEDVPSRFETVDHPVEAMGRI